MSVSWITTLVFLSGPIQLFIDQEWNHIDFTNEEAYNLSHPHHDAFAINILISNCSVNELYIIDNERSTNVIFNQNTYILKT